MKTHSIIYLALVALLLSACGGSNSNPSPRYNNNTSDLTFAEKYPLFDDVVLTNSELVYYDADNYQPVAASSNSLVGTWLVVDQSIYTIDGYWIYDQLDVRNLTRKLVSIIQASDDSYWMVTSNREAEVFRIVRENSEIYMQYPVYGMNGYVDGELVDNNRINASLRSYDPVEVTASEISFIKISNTPTLGGLLTGNTQTLGEMSFNLINNFLNEVRGEISAAPVHYFEDGFEEAIYYNDGEIVRHLETELVIVSAMAENFDEFIANPSDNDDWQKMWSNTYYYWNDYSKISNELTTQHNAFIRGDLHRYYFDASLVSQQTSVNGLSIFYENQLADQSDYTDDETPLFTASMDIEVDFSSVQ